MKIAIASGKGGTGKTTFSVAMTLANRDRVRIVDCDVEEPNVHLFLSGEHQTTETVWASIPKVDPDLCTACGACVAFCQYNALALAGAGGLLVFPELCHDCGGCIRVCPSHALSETRVKRGTVETTIVGGDIELVTGRLEVGSPSAPTVIRAAVAGKPLTAQSTTILDAPPGTACSFAACMQAADHCILVTDPTPFGLHDLALAIEAIQNMSMPFSVVINRSTGPDDMASLYCQAHGYDVVLRISESREIAEAYSQGKSLLDVVPGIRGDFRAILDDLRSNIAEKEIR